jgi:hypothetical protein
VISRVSAGRFILKRKMVTTKSAKIRENQGVVKIDQHTRKVEVTIFPTL